jgi:hypothetical protein
MPAIALRVYTNTYIHHIHMCGREREGEKVGERERERKRQRKKERNSKEKRTERRLPIH